MKEHDTSLHPAEKAAFAQILDSMPDALVLVEQNGSIAYANRRLEMLSGYAPDELVGRAVELLVPDRFRQAHAAHRSGYHASGHPSRPMGTGLDIRVKRKDGSEFPADIALSPLHLDDRMLIVAAVRDITERKRVQDRLEAINEVTRLILEGREPDDVLDVIARLARELAGAALATIAAPDPLADTMVVRVAEGFRSDELAGMRFATHGSISDEVMRTRKPLLVSDAATDARVHQPVVAIGEVGPILAVPLAAGDKVFGTLIVGNRRNERVFTNEDLTLVQAFASQAAVAIEYARVHEELQRLAVVEDRERIAKELHDDIIQSLFAEGMALQAAEAMTHDPEAMRARLAAAVEHIDRVIRDLRNYIFALRPGGHADRQLDRSLRDLVDSFRDGAGAELELRIDADAVAALAGKANDVLQAAREALSNAVRHSGAARVSVVLEQADGSAILTVEDDGKGFDLDEARDRGNGLRNLRARAESLNGTLDVDAVPGKGTTVRVVMPT